jgi:uncharacterized UBP type Zn finger protein
MMKCKHFENLKEVKSQSKGCVDCLKINDKWFHLRMCLVCGYIGCCDNSKNKHATKHFKRTKHPVIKSFEPDEDWSWCYIDEKMFE